MLADPTGRNQPHVLRSYEPDEIRRWLRVMIKMSGLSATALSKRANLAPSTINRFLNDPEVKHILSASTLSKIESAAAHAYEERVKITYGQGIDAYSAHNPGYPDDEQSELINISKLPLVRVVGAVEAGSFKEAIEWPPSEHYAVPSLQFKQFLYDPKFALEVRGTSMDLLYPEGTILICVPLVHVDRNPVPGERVVVRRRMPNGLIEATVKELQLDREGNAWLWPRSSDPSHQQPLPFTSPGNEEEDIAVTALVIGSLRPEVTP